MLLLLNAALAQGLEPCATPWLLPDLDNMPRVPATAPPPAGGKGLRNAYDGLPNLVTSDNFALWWGGQGGVSESKAEALLEAFEASWSVEVELLGHEAPEGSDAWLFNVYIGSTGNGAPSDYGAAGYYYLDPDGWPMVVVNTSTANDPYDYGRSVVAHEFYHALQAQTGSYAYSARGDFTDGAWFWEATANWVVSEVFPDDTWHGVFLFGYLLVPERELGSFTYPDGSLEGYHQYGAFLFPRYLTEHVVDPEVIVQTWKEGTRTGDPLEVLSELLLEEGEDLASLFTDFATRNVVYDYVHGEDYEAMVESYAPAFAASDHRLTAVVRGDGDGDWFAVDPEFAPARYGYNLVRFEWPDDGDLVIDFQGEDDGTEGSPSTWVLAVVLEGDEGVSSEFLDSEEGRWRLEEVDGLEAVTLVVVAAPESAEQDERFDYRWRMEIVEALPEVLADINPQGEDPLAASCACDTGRVPGVWIPLVLLCVGARRRGAAPEAG